MPDGDFERMPNIPEDSYRTGLFVAHNSAGESVQFIHPDAP